MMRLSVVKDDAARLDLARQAADETWNVRQVESAVAEWQQGQRSGEKRGRKPMAAPLRVTLQLQRLAAQVADVFGELEELEDDALAQCTEALEAAAKQIEAARAAILARAQLV